MVATQGDAAPGSECSAERPDRFRPMDPSNTSRCATVLPVRGSDVRAVFGFAHRFLALSTEHSKKMLAPLKTRNMLRDDN
jgi:hypothetical protein